MGEPIDQTKDCKVKPEDKNAEQDEARKLKEVIEPIIISKDLPDEKKVEQIAHIIKVSRECFSGPMPPPKILKGYKEIIPDAPERILQMAEREQRHRESAENEMLAQNRCNIEGAISANRRSQIFAFILVLVLIGTGVILTYLEHEAVGITIFGTTIIAFASIFVVGKVKQKNKDSGKDKSEK